MQLAKKLKKHVSHAFNCNPAKWPFRVVQGHHGSKRGVFTCVGWQVTLIPYGKRHPVALMLKFH